MRRLKMLCTGHTEVKNPDPTKPSQITHHRPGDVLTFEDAREADALRLCELGVAIDVTAETEPAPAAAASPAAPPSSSAPPSPVPAPRPAPPLTPAPPAS